ncbi:MAG: DUF3794 domain-containing protein, partial [Clostridia bacterium]|nr:DUF3794 domain-containing protein [Clostridia bacterium]
MENTTQITKISYLKNLNKINLNSTINLAIDNNANIKTILNIDSYLFDQKVECGNGKAIISGKLGVKVLYVDTDNFTNTVSETTNFSETIVDQTITSETKMNILNSTILNNILSADNILKINCEIVIYPTTYLNLGLNNQNETSEMLVCKKKEIQTNTISNFVNTEFNYTTNIETKDVINKILCNSNYFSAEKVFADNGFAVVEGKIMTTLVYETQKDDEVVIKEISNIKCDIEIPELSKENLLDLTFVIDKSKEDISTEIEDNLSILILKHSIKVCGAIMQNIAIEVVDDAFCTTNELKTTAISRDFSKGVENFAVCETVSNEISLTKDETAIDELIANMSIEPEIINTYIKNDLLYVEGIVTSNMSYVDENKEFKSKTIQVPFGINTKINVNNLNFCHSNISVEDSKIKIKRGTIIETEYCLFISITLCNKEQH